MKVYIIRHGQTDWNKKGKIQGKRLPLKLPKRRKADRGRVDKTLSRVGQEKEIRKNRLRTVFLLYGKIDQ